MFTSAQAVLINQMGNENEKEAEANARRAVGRLFDQAYRRGKLGLVWSKLRGKPNKLQSRSGQGKASRRPFGITVVPLSRIVGSEGRSEDFDAEFHPLKLHNRDRWISIAAAQWLGKTLPAVELVQHEDGYYIRDGHHRISVARSLGQLEIDARVVN